MKPNVFHISWHDVGRFLGCYGVEQVHTPCLDALAAGGVRFTNYWATAAFCSPSRAAAMTGRYPQSNGVLGLAHRPQRYSINPGERHVSHVLRDAGYHTALIGWQHETVHTLVRRRLAFDEVHYNDPMPPCHVVAPFAADWLRARRPADGPFYLQLGFMEVHRPHDFGGVGPDTERGVYVPPWLQDTEEGRRQLAQQQGMIRKADAHVGMVLDALREAGLERDTIVVFTSDHGIHFPRAKGTLYDPGIGIPLIVRWPGGGIEGGGTCDDLLSNVDFLPTLLELIDIPAPDKVQGSSFAGVFRGERAAREAVYGMVFCTTRAVRTDRYKLVWNTGERQWTTPPVDPVHPRGEWHWPTWELYDLEADPMEGRNLIARQELAGVLDKLHALLWDWMESVDDPILRGPEVEPYYERAMALYRKRRG